MYYIKYKVTNTICSACNGILHRGKRRFGPAKVKCGHCGVEVETGLQRWNDYTFFEKITTVIKEIIQPSFLRGMSIVQQLLILMAHHAGIMMPATFILLLPVMIVTKNFQALPVVIIFSIYPIFFFLWLKKMIKESVHYDKNEIIPEWK